MTPIVRILLVALAAAISIAAVTSTADARPKKPGAVAKGCTAEGETMASGTTMEVLEETSKGVLVRKYTCVNGKVCLKAYDENGNRINGDGDCWMSPASLLSQLSGQPVAPTVQVVKRR